MKETVTLNLSHALKLKEILEYKNKVEKIHKSIFDYSVDEKEWLGWIEQPSRVSNEEIEKMENIVDLWQMNKIEAVVIIGIGGSYLGAKSGYEFMFGPYSPNKPKIELIFSGNTVSSESLINQLKYLENKKFAINVISKSGTTLEPAIAFREFRKLLERNVGIPKARDFIVATTDAKKGKLFDFANQMGYHKLVVPDDIGGRFSVLSPVGLFPFICAGINVRELLKGAHDCVEYVKNKPFEENYAYQYAAARHILSKKYNVEMMVNYEPKLRYFSEWWKQLFGESEGKNNLGLLPTSCQFSTDLHSLGQFIQEGKKILFESHLILDKPKKDLILDFKKEQFDDGLVYLDGKSLHEINWNIFESSVEAHSKDANIPNLVFHLKDDSEYSLGYLFQFFMFSVTMSAYLLGVNPFNQPGVEIYKTNMSRILN
ncbi:glucose-6-phosphate isomerase [Mycoplasma sp. Mirounga ES2805-ORL]|uniref:glucose-6-phosphate isomerase n=1 Tax=Mycoplasma sp. Mirounga ES2805-ORL TaxID=754514 RepID=UPI00197C02FA|nr:glucose-6-phosphate isomerase [Mycoplasma sp. Mirounga ES2805-ORL]QSF13694.1 glucose-6-phosphate isomerase [Mycoplasma sp. Mirounga ES2805-ORL]